MHPKAFLLDIEGTTTPVDFVTKTLFPFARRGLSRYVSDHWADPELELDVRGLGRGNAPDEFNDPIAVTDRLLELMDGDVKSTPLKSIQGRIWEEGYRTGQLQGAVYPDVEPALRRWRARGATIHIYSSGSVLAQKLLFGHLPQGDLTPLIDSYFDTTTGPKREATSYRRIAAAIGASADQILFLSDVREEVEAAREAGLSARIVVREGNVDRDAYAICTFDDIE